MGQLATRVIEITANTASTTSPAATTSTWSAAATTTWTLAAVLRKAREAKRDAKQNKRGKQRGKAADPQASRRKLEARVAELTAEIEGAEARIEALNERFCAPDFMELPPAERSGLETEHAELSRSLAEWMETWEELERELEALPPA